MTDDVHDEVDERLRRTRQRYTAGRRDLVDALLRAGRPLAIAELAGLDAAQSQSSLYRNLAVLERSGVLHRVASTDEVARFELAEELSHHHHHLACGTCGRLEDFVLPPEVERALYAAADAAADDHGFHVRSHRVELLGTCTACR